VWTPLPGPAEDEFWDATIAEGERLLDGLLIVDAGEIPSPRLAALPAAEPGAATHGVHRLRVNPDEYSLSDMQALAARLGAAGTVHPVCCRLAGPVREPGSTLARHCAPALVLVLADAGRLAFWEEQARLQTTGVKAPAGVLLANEPDLLRVS
jgi:hypothetical protein